MNTVLYLWAIFDITCHVSELFICLGAGEALPSSCSTPFPGRLLTDVDLLLLMLDLDLILQP